MKQNDQTTDDLKREARERADLLPEDTRWTLPSMSITDALEFIARATELERKRCAEIARTLVVAKTDEASEAAESIATAILADDHEK